MADIAVGDIVQMSFKGLACAQRILFTRMFRVSTAPALATPVQNFCDNILVSLDAGGANQGYKTEYLACLSAGYQLQEMRAQVVKPIRYAARKLAVAVNGTRGALTTANTAAVITCSTALAGRDQISNLHIGPIASADSAAGFIAAGLLGDLGVFKDDLISPFVVGVGLGEMDPVIYHKSPKPGHAAYDVIEESVVQDTTRVMRRRTVGRGE